MDYDVARKQNQLSKVEAYKSILVKNCRWLVESRRATIKSMFQFSDETINPPIVMEGANEQVEEELLQRSRLPNVVKAR